MPDISMCSGQATNLDGKLPHTFVCPIRDKCYRFTAKPSDYQCYFVLPPMTGGKDCEFFWDDSRGEKK